MSSFFTRLWSLRPDGIESIVDYAKFLGLHREQLSRYKGGLEPRLPTVRKIAKKLGCDPGWLLFEPSDRDVKRNRKK